MSNALSADIHATLPRMYSPPWRIWLTGLLTFFWAALAVRFFAVKNDPVLGGLCLLMALWNAYMTWQLWRSKNEPVPFVEAETPSAPPRE